jgi:hypothetical protein
VRSGHDQPDICMRVRHGELGRGRVAVKRLVNSTSKLGDGSDAAASRDQHHHVAIGRNRDRRGHPAFANPDSNPDPTTLPAGCVRGTLQIVHHLDSGAQQALCLHVGSVLDIQLPKESHGPWALPTVSPSQGVMLSSSLDSQQTRHVTLQMTAAGSYTMDTVTDDGPDWSGPQTPWRLQLTVQP